MCRELDALRQSIRAYADGFDARSLIPAQAVEVVGICSQMVSSIEAIKALAAAVAAEGPSWKDEGYRSPAEQLAARTGTTTGHARQTLETGRRMADQPDVARAALAGQLSPEQATVIADGAEADPARARDLIRKAGCSSVRELSDEVARVKAAAADLEERRRRVHAQRRLRVYKDLEGAFHTHAVGHPEDGATLHRVIATVRRRLHMLSREDGRFETFEALDYDALMTVARVALGQDAAVDLAEMVELGLFPQLRADPGPFRPPPAPPEAGTGAAGAPEDAGAEKGARRSARKVAGSDPKVIVRVDLATLLRGVPLEGELCQIEGYGPVPVSVIEDIVARGGLLAAVLTKGSQVLGVYHHRRRPNAHQKTALDFVYPTCAAQGCDSRVALQSDHRQDWARTGFTVLDLLDQLCPHHHRLKTQKGWGLVDGHGKRAFVPPEDARHPRHGRQRC